MNDELWQHVKERLKSPSSSFITHHSSFIFLPSHRGYKTILNYEWWIMITLKRTSKKPTVIIHNSSFIIHFFTLSAGFHSDSTQNWACHDAGFQTQIIAGSIFGQKMTSKLYHRHNTTRKIKVYRHFWGYRRNSKILTSKSFDNRLIMSISIALSSTWQKAADPAITLFNKSNYYQCFSDLIMDS